MKYSIMNIIFKTNLRTCLSLALFLFMFNYSQESEPAMIFHPDKGKSISMESTNDSRDKEIQMAQIITFSGKKLTVKQALDEMYKLPGLSIVYGSNEKLPDVVVVFSSLSLSIEKALAEIENQAPVDFIYNSGHVIVKSRKLENTYFFKGRLTDWDTGEGLVSAYVIIVGTPVVGISDNNGYFSLQLKPGTYSVKFSYLGYEEKRSEIKLFRNVDMDVSLKTKIHQINTVNVKGSLGIKEAIEPGRQIATIESKVIDRINTNDVNDALQGRVEGVWATKTSGAPGDHHKIRIRGISSIFGSTDPLYVVDGAIIPVVNFENMGISDLNVHDIDKMTILKDASSNSIYGNLGSNGVILIETKKGGGESHITFGIKQGIQNFSKRYPLMDAEDFYGTLQLSDDLINTSFYKRYPTRHLYEKYPVYRDPMGTTLSEKNYQDELFRIGYISEYQLSGTGSFKTIDYYISGNFYNHKGVIKNTNYQKYTVTANLSKVIADKFSVRFLFKGSHQTNLNTIDNYLGNNVILKGINYEPSYAATPDSFLTKSERLYFNDFTNRSITNLSRFSLSFDSLIYANNKIKNDNSNSMNLHLFYKINKELSFRALASLSFKNLVYSSKNSPAIYGVGSKKFLETSEKYIYFNHQYELNYSKQLKEHNFNAFLRYRGYRDNVKWEIDSIANVSYDGIAPEDDIFLRGSQAIYGEQGSVLRSINSTIVNVNYNFNRKYFLSWISNYETIKEGTTVSDGQLFNSLAVNWDLSRERILNFPRWINSFNLCFNYGESGNYPLNSLSDDLFSTSSSIVSNDSIVRAAYLSNLANHDLQPEKEIEINGGFNFSLFKERLKFSADYYRKRNTNLLIKRTIPLYYGGGTIYENIGEMKNEGLEISLEATPVNTTSFYWNTRIGFSTNHQVITVLYEGQSINFNNTDVLIPDFIAKVNEPLGTITGYKYAGKWNDFDKEEQSKYVKSLGLAYLKNDTISPKRTAVNVSDKMVIGSSIPDFTFNWSNVIEYKNFSCEMLWYGVVGVDKYNATRASTFITGLNKEVRNIVQDTMKYFTNNVYYESSCFVEDASFIRLKTLSFSYTPTKKIASKISMEYTLSFENLLTITPYSGYDPEASIYTDNNFSDNAIDKGAYPNPAGVFISINMTF
jgi:TonB-dependent starch-binding outer membrane protein SusC